MPYSKIHIKINQTFLDPNSNLQHCCYTCRDLPDKRSYILPNGFSDQCPAGTYPNQTTFKQCDQLQIESLDASKPWAVIAICMALFGLLVALAVLVFTCMNFSHTVIKNSGRDLATMVWIGIVINHMNTFFVFFTWPGTFSCSLTR